MLYFSHLYFKRSMRANVWITLQETMWTGETAEILVDFKEHSSSHVLALIMKLILLHAAYRFHLQHTMTTT